MIRHLLSLKTLGACFCLSLCLSLSVCGLRAKEKTYPSDPLENLKHRLVDQLVFVEGGTFEMGDVGYTNEQGQFRYFTNDANVHPVHTVTLSSYSIQAYETRFADFDLYMTSIGEEIVKKDRRKLAFYQPNSPAKSLTWYQAYGYCQWLGQQIGYPTTLATEAQWEYAARSRGKAVAYATDNGDFEPGRNIRDPHKNEFQMPVGSWPPNPLGIYDMTGNVSEWTLDLWHPYSEEPLTNPSYNDAETAQYTSQRMWRDSGVIGGKGQTQLYRRGIDGPDNDGAGHGIRCVVNHPEKILAPRQMVASNTREP